LVPPSLESSPPVNQVTMELPAKVGPTNASPKRSDTIRAGKIRRNRFLAKVFQDPLSAKLLRTRKPLIQKKAGTATTHGFHEKFGSTSFQTCATTTSRASSNRRMSKLG